MKSALFFVIMFLTISLNCEAQAPQAVFTFVNDYKKLKEGDLVEGVIRVWPIENASLEEFKSLESLQLFNSFLPIKLESISLSPNNADVVEIKVLYLVKSSKLHFNESLKYKNLLIPLSVEVFQVDSLAVSSKEYFILKQNDFLDNTMKIILGVAALLVLVMILINFNFIKKYFNNKKNNKLKLEVEMYAKKFQDANVRIDFEEIYASKNTWMKLLRDVTPAHQEFFKTINQYQFKPSWSDSELEEVRYSFDVIRGSFK